MLDWLVFGVVAGFSCVIWWQIIAMKRFNALEAECSRMDDDWVRDVSALCDRVEELEKARSCWQPNR